MAMIGMSPWAAAAGGLAGGLGQGIITGVDLVQRRRQEEAQKQRDAMSLLITGFKHLSDDPDALKQFTQWVGQTTGMPVPPWVGGTGGGVAGKLAQQRDQMKAAGFSDAQINAYLFSLKDKGETPHGVKWFQVPGQGYRSFAYGETPPPGSIPMATEPPMMPILRQTPEGGVEPTGGYAPKGAPIIKLTEIETTKPMTPTEVADFTANAQKRLNDARGEEEVAEITRQIKEQGGDVKTINVPGFFGFGTNQKRIVVPPATRVQTKRPSVPGFLGNIDLKAAFNKKKAQIDAMPDGPTKQAAQQQLEAWRQKNLGQ